MRALRHLIPALLVFCSALGWVAGSGVANAATGRVSISASPNPATETGNSNVYAVFYVSTSPVFAEGTALITSGQLAGRCRGGTSWRSNNGTFSGATATGTLDNDGNVVFVFLGSACAAGKSSVIADVTGGGSRRYTFTILPPRPHR